MSPSAPPDRIKPTRPDQSDCTADLKGARMTNDRTMTQQQQAELIRDVFNASHDVVALAEAHGLSPNELSQWITEPDNKQCLSGLCVLADLQTQLMLSRYRLVAVTKLIQQATQQEDVSAEQARKACADLLKLDLTRLGLDDLTQAQTGEDGEDTDTLSASQLRAMLYSDDAPNQTSPSTREHNPPTRDQ
jgi:transposase-like protein